MCPNGLTKNNRKSCTMLLLFIVISKDSFPRVPHNKNLYTYKGAENKNDTPGPGTYSYDKK